MTPDIQELKDKALAAADLANHLNGIDPYTILALIEENERLTKFIRKTFYVSKADGGIRYSWECDLDLCEVFVDDAITPIRTALEGVKK